MKPTHVDRPDFPEGYGTHDSVVGLLEWDNTEARLKDELHYWMATARADGRPHVVPRWGAWIDGQLFYDGSPETRHAKNLAFSCYCTLSIGGGADAVIIDGTSAPSKPLPVAEAAPIRDEIIRKYASLGYTPEEGSWSDEVAGGLHVFTPTKALVWNDFAVDPTRFTF